MSDYQNEETLEYWQSMTRNLLANINEALPRKWRVPPADIERIANRTSSYDEPMEHEMSCDLANLMICAVRMHEIQPTT